MVLSKIRQWRRKTGESGVESQRFDSNLECWWERREFRTSFWEWLCASGQGSLLIWFVRFTFGERTASSNHETWSREPQKSSIGFDMAMFRATAEPPTTTTYRCFARPDQTLRSRVIRVLVKE